jgi:hypothetical protein
MSWLAVVATPPKIGDETGRNVLPVSSRERA